MLCYICNLKKPIGVSTGVCITTASTENTLALQISTVIRKVKNCIGNSTVEIERLRARQVCQHFDFILP